MPLRYANACQPISRRVRPERDYYRLKQQQRWPDLVNPISVNTQHNPPAADIRKASHSAPLLSVFSTTRPNMYPKKRLRASRELLLLLNASVSGHSSRATQLLLLLLIWSSDSSLRGITGPLLLTGTDVSSHAAA